MIAVPSVHHRLHTLCCHLLSQSRPQQASAAAVDRYPHKKKAAIFYDPAAENGAAADVFSLMGRRERIAGLV